MTASGLTPSRIFVTGGNGFVGTRLLARLRSDGHHVDAPVTDITDRDALAAAVAEARPDAVIHLAAQASVAASWNDPDDTYRVNVDGTRIVLDAARQHSPHTRVLIVSSADVYGPTAFAADGRADETSPTRPLSPYGASKLMAEVLARQAFDGHQLPTVIARSFNHIGPGQSPSFAVSAFARQIALAEHGEQGSDGSGPAVVEVGNLAASRDFLAVDDVIEAYLRLLAGGHPGETYNVASGVATTMDDVLAHLVSQATRPIRVTVDPARFRPVEVASMVGDVTKIRAHTGWEPRSGWREAASASLAWWRDNV